MAERAECEDDELKDEIEDFVDEVSNSVTKSIPRVSLAQRKKTNNAHKLHMSQLSAMCRKEFLLNGD